jgi:hypothetical protein
MGVQHRVVLVAAGGGSLPRGRGGRHVQVRDGGARPGTFDISPEKVNFEP